MNDKEYKALKKKIEKLVIRWRDRLGLNSYRLHQEWRRNEPTEDQNTGAMTKMRWEYLEADFIWYMPNLVSLTDNELEEVVVHEFCHILLAPLMHEDTEHGRMVYERVTTTVQRAITYTFDDRSLK